MIPVFECSALEPERTLPLNGTQRNIQKITLRIKVFVTAPGNYNDFIESEAK